MNGGKEMKGVILAGGTGSRMLPLTKSVNKHLLPVGEKPMLQHCVEKLCKAGVTDIMVITGGEHLGGIAEFLGSGKDFDCDFTFRVQDRAGGIAEALGLCRDFVGDGDVCVVLGDNMFEDDLHAFVSQFYIGKAAGLGAMNILKEVPDPERFGVAELSFQTRNPDKERYGDDEWVEVTKKGDIEHVKNGYKMMPSRYRIAVSGIEEKPKEPKSSWAVTGIYMYDSEVFEIASEQRPSDRGELEITDVNNAYIERGKMGCSFFEGWWSDAGTHESYAKANQLVRGECDG
jgi:glucose-1-phosphate thymidylyltransferase